MSMELARAAWRAAGVGKARSVFDELDLVEASSFGTWEIVVEARDVADRDAIVALFDDTDVHVEDWTESIRVLCKACSLGEPHEAHPPREPKGWISERRLGAAARHEDDLRPLRRLLGRWRKGVRSVERVL
jgi:hypothetical protein